MFFRFSKPHPIFCAGLYISCLTLLAACNNSTDTSIPHSATVPAQLVQSAPTQGTSSPSSTSTSTTAADLPYDPLIRPDPGSRTITGSAVVAGSGSPIANIVPVSGRIGPDGTQFVLSDTQFTFRDPDGPDASGNYADGTNDMLIEKSGFKHAAIYGADYPNGAATGVFGIATEAGDMPRSGKATYKGIGEIAEVYASQLTQQAETAIQAATSEVSVDFASGRVDAALQADTTRFQLYSRVNRLAARDMKISRNGFSGTNIKMFDNGTRVYPLTRQATGAAEGQFYGAKYDTSSNLIPAEVGGVISTSTSTGSVIGTFIAK